MENLVVHDSGGCCCGACGPDAAGEQSGVAQVGVTFEWGPGPAPSAVTEGQAAVDCCGCEGCGCC